MHAAVLRFLDDLEKARKLPVRIGAAVRVVSIAQVGENALDLQTGKLAQRQNLFCRARFVFHRTESEPGHSGVHLHMHLQPSGPERGLILPRRFEGVYRHADIFRSGGPEPSVGSIGPRTRTVPSMPFFLKVCASQKLATPKSRHPRSANARAAGSMPTP